MAKTETDMMQDTQFQAMDLPIELIVVDEEWNNRVSLDGADTFHKGTKEGGDKPAMSGQTVEDLAALIKQSKNFVPVTVSIRPDGTYFLVAGFRRIAAVKSLGWKTVPVTAAQMSPVQEVEWNILENKGRKDLSTFETARGVVRFAEVLAKEGKSRAGGKAKGGKGAEGWGSTISKRLGMSRTAVNLYIRLFTKLREEILEAWEAGESIPITLLDQWASESKPEQLKLFKAWQGEAEAEENEGGAGGEGSGGGSDGANTSTRPSKGAFVFALAHFAEIAKTEKEPEIKASAKAIVAALEWSMGNRKTLAGVNVLETMKKRKAADKAARDAAKAGEDEADEADA